MNWMPHGFCIAWNPHILVLQVLANAVIACAYFTIPWFLWKIMREHDKTINALGIRAVLGAFTIFICACGLTHIMDIITVWTPLYVLDVVIRTLTAVASASTAYGLVKLLPILAGAADAPKS